MGNSADNRNSTWNTVSLQWWHFFGGGERSKKSWGAQISIKKYMWSLQNKCHFYAEIAKFGHFNTYKIILGGNASLSPTVSFKVM